MTQESPFGIKRPVPAARDENSIRFAVLKPICVELLGSITTSKGSSNVDSVFAVLKRLHYNLSLLISPEPDRIPLSPSLINYVFFPLAQLLRSTSKGEADLPDRVRQAVFQILTSLTSDWWQTWTDCLSPPSSETAASKITDQWKVWEQLLILGAVALGGPPDGKAQSHKACSEEAQVAICSFIQELLLPRLAVAAIAPAKAEKEWEWDGEEELPSLDDYDQFQHSANGEQLAPINGNSVQVYPSSAQLRHVFSNKACRGAIAHTLTASLDLACTTNASAAVKIACLKISRTIISCWLADEFPQIEEPSSLFKQITVEKIFSGRREGDDIASTATTPADRVAVFLPGYVSSMVRILGTTSTRDNSQVISQALLSLAVILQVCLCDAASVGLSLPSNGQNGARAEQAASIDELVARVIIDDQQEASVGDAIPAEVETARPQIKGDPTQRNSDWLDNTVAHVVIALYSIDPLSNQKHPQVQLSLVHLAFVLLARCSLVLALQRSALRDAGDSDNSIDATRLLLRWIVDVAASDLNMESAVTSAHDSLRLLFSSPSDLCRGAVNEEMLNIIQAIPSLLASQNDDYVERKANRLHFLLNLSTSGFDSSLAVFEGVKSLLQPSSGVDKWGTTLLWSIKIDDRASMEQSSSLLTLQGLSSTASKAVMGIFEEIGRALCRMIRRDCFAGVEINDSFKLVWSLMDQATANRSTLMTASNGQRHSHLLCQNALIVVDRMTHGVAEILDDAILAVQTSKEGKKIRKAAHRFAKEMIRRVSDLWAEDEEELLQQDVSARQNIQSSAERSLLTQEHTEMATVERRKGLIEQMGASFERPAGFGPALKLDFVTAATLPKSGVVQGKAKSALQIQTEAKNQLDRSDALLLSILTSSAKVLGPSLKPLLLKMLYPIICGVSSQSSTIREAAIQSMDEMARSAGYASVQGCVLDHADYVLGTASHRLVSTLGQELQAIAMRDPGDEMIHFPLVSAQSAPLVLVEIIRMLGGEALTLVQDAIDEVLDAIDRHHLQETLCDDLLNVLSRLIEVMLEDERSKTGSDLKKKHSMVNSASIAFHPDVDRDMEELQKWWLRRQSKRKSDEAPMQNQTEAPDEESQAQDEPDTSSPSQAVVVSILEKAVPFLSHSSAMIRIRCLRLLSWGIELLCLQGRTVEPLQVVNKAWPAIMSRLGFSLSLSLSSFDKRIMPAYENLSEKDFVACTEAAKLVTTLAKYLVEYLGPKKMLKQAVPRLLLLLKIVEKAEGKVQTGRQGSQRTFLLKDEPVVSKALPLLKFQPLQRYTPLYSMTENVLSLLDTLVVAMGPHLTEADLYQYAVHPILLSCLDKRQDDNMQKVAHQFYLSTLLKRNENLVWLVLSGAQDKDDQFPSFFHRPELDLQW